MCVAARKTAHQLPDSHQIRTQADRLLGPELADVDGIPKLVLAQSQYSTSCPAVETFESPESESEAVAVWLEERLADGLQPEEIGIFVRSEAQLPRAKAALEAAGLAYKVLDQKMDTVAGSASLCTMHLAKGLNSAPSQSWPVMMRSFLARTY